MKGDKRRSKIDQQRLKAEKTRMKAGEQRSSRYVYCVIKCPEEPMSFGSIGYGDEDVHTIAYRDFAPVVSYAPVKKYEAGEEEVEVHKRVVGEVMKDLSVLPVAYGMVFKNKKLLSVAMKAGYKAMKKAMKTADNRIELGVKVILPKDATGLDGEIDQCKSDFMESLKVVAADSKELKLFSDRLLLNLAFLVDRDKIDEFSSRVGDLGAEYSGLKVQYSGPWPPHNFVDIHILGNKKGGFR